MESGWEKCSSRFSKGDQSWLDTSGRSGRAWRRGKPTQGKGERWIRIWKIPFGFCWTPSCSPQAQNWGLPPSQSPLAVNTWSNVFVPNCHPPSIACTVTVQFVTDVACRYIYANRYCWRQKEKCQIYSHQFIISMISGSFLTYEHPASTQMGMNFALANTIYCSPVCKNSIEIED